MDIPKTIIKGDWEISLTSKTVKYIGKSDKKITYYMDLQKILMDIWDEPELTRCDSSLIQNHSL